MFPCLLIPVVFGCGSVAEIETNNRNLELNLRVIEAFEHGPVILEVSLKNRGDKPLAVDWGNDPERRLTFPESWNAKVRIPCGFGGIITGSLEPGESRVERHVLHETYCRFKSHLGRAVPVRALFSLHGTVPSRAPLAKQVG